MSEFVSPLVDQTDEYWIFANNNKYSKSVFTIEDAIEFNATLVECYDCIDCFNCVECYDCIDCNDCGECYDCSECEACDCCIECYGEHRVKNIHTERID